MTIQIEGTAVKSVTVYTDRARIIRQGSARVMPDTEALEVSGLPDHIDVDSVRAAARGTARARLLGVEVRRKFFSETPAERVRELEKQLIALGDAVGDIDAQIGILKDEQVTLGELASQTETFARGLAYGRTTASDQMALFDRLRERSEAINAALRDLTTRRREVERERQRVEQELKQHQSAAGRWRHVAIVSLDVQQAGDLTLDLTYVVSGAGWRPLYDIRLSDGETETEMEVSFLAQVTQQSGEDWESAALILSTARPALAETAPELTPWIIGPQRSAPGGTRGATRALKAAPPAPAEAEGIADRALLGYDAGADLEAMAASSFATAEVESTGAAVTYRAPAKVTIPADGAPHKVAIARFDLQPDMDYMSAPKLVEAAYRRATVVNDSVYTLLAGNVNLFAGDEFIGRTELPLIAPQGEIALSFGVDDRVKVSRDLARRDVDKRLIGDRRRLHIGYTIDVENLLATEASVTIHDQIPVARHEAIKVRLEGAEPAPTEQTELNLLTWELTLAAGETRQLRFDFVVEHPRDVVLEGLSE